MSRALGIAVTGPPGAGKTALASELVRRLPRAALLTYDDYETATGQSPDEIVAWLDAGGDPNRLDLREFTEAAIAMSARGGLVIVDTPFGRAHQATAGLIDFQIWLDIPPDIALARKIRQMAGWAAEDRAPDAARRFAGWLAAYLDNYAGFVARACILQRELVRPMSDLILAPDRDPAGLAETAIAELERRGMVGAPLETPL